MSGINTQLSFLVVEDNPGDIFLLKEFLHATDLDIGNILEVDRLSEAKRVLAEQNIDLVFLDLSLPDSFGLDSYISLSAEAQHLPVILLTGRTWAADTTAEELGARALIRKPFDLDDLLRTVESTVGDRQA